MFLLLLSLALIASCVDGYDTCQDILDVAIIGSGPGGLSAARALHHITGLSKVVVYERASAFRPIGAALGLNTLAYDTLKEFGMDLHDRVRSIGSNPQRHVLQRPSGEIIYDDESFLANTDFNWLSWYNLQTALRVAAEGDADTGGISIQLNSKLVDFEEDEEAGIVRLHFDDGKVVHTRMLIGADGYNSIVRGKTVDDGKPIFTGTMTWRGVMDRSHFNKIVKIEPFKSIGDGVNLSIVGDAKNFWVMDCGEGQIAWTGTAIYNNENSADKHAPANIKALNVFKNWPPIIETLIEATEASAIVESGVYDREPVSSWGALKGTFKRTTLLGDAAHPIRPSLGLGSTLAFQDSKCLADNLSGVDLGNTENVANALKLYEKERIDVTTPLQKKARQEGANSHAENRAEQMKAHLDASLATKKKTTH